MNKRNFIKSNSGFSLIEVMVALVVAALVITPLTRLVMRAVTVISERNSQLENYIKLQSFLYESRLYDVMSTEFTREEIVTPRKTVKYIRSAVSDKSSLQTPFLTKEIVTMQDKDVAENRQDKLVVFFTMLPMPTKKDEKSVSVETSKETKMTGQKKENQETEE